VDQSDPDSSHETVISDKSPQPNPEPEPDPYPFSDPEPDPIIDPNPEPVITRKPFRNTLVHIPRDPETP
jgi:hypothetical protein